MKLLFLILSLTSVAQAQQLPDFSIRFNQSAFVKITYKNNPRSWPVNVETFNVLPAFDNPERLDTLKGNNGSRLLNVPVCSAQRGHFQVNKIQYDIFLIPKDTIQIAIDFHQDTTWHDRNLTFTSSDSSYQNYYRQANLALPKRAMTRAFAANNAPDLLSYQRVMDSIWRAEDSFFSAYRQRVSLPDWFVKAEATFLTYQDASYRENAVILRRFMNRKKTEPIPNDYFSFHTRAPVVNLSAQHLSNYWGFVSDYLFLQSDRPIGQPLDGIWMDKDFALADRLLPAKLAELRKLHSLSGMAKSDPTKAIFAIQKWAPSLPSKLLVRVIEADAKGRINRLKTGDIAPNFFLPDLQDSLTTLKGFRGNVVLLCFWFPGCKPCVAEFPYENKLVASFKNKPVQIISICALGSRESWQKAVKKYKLKTMNLYANANWQKTLELKYAITGYPHYVLIDKKGRIVKNFASRPSMHALDEISTLLK